MIDKDYFMQRKTAVIFAVILLVIGSTIYFAFDIATKNSDSMNKLDAINPKVLFLLQNVQLKAAYTDEGTIDMFALAKNKDLARINSSLGISIPKQGGMVLGNVEGSMMQKEDEFKNIGDTLIDYNVVFRVDGVLVKTNTFADDFHFINLEQYTILTSDSNKLLVKFKDINTPKLFYLYDTTRPSSVKLEFSEGSLDLFYPHVNRGKIYYPLILGSKEAKMMKEEKLFTKVGDTLDNFFGKDVIIVGVLVETNTGMDMMHFVEPDFFNDSQKVVKGALV